MLTITLTPELEKIVTEKSTQLGTTPELYLLDDLNTRYCAEIPAEEIPLEGETMADFFKGYIGMVDSREFGNGPSNLSQDTGKKFTELMVKKYRAGKL